MSFFEELKDFISVLRRLASHWRMVLALAVLLGLGGLYVTKKLFPAQPPAESARLAQKPAGAPPTRPQETAGPESEAKSEPPVETPEQSVASQTIEVAAKPVLFAKGDGKWEEPAKTLSAAIAKVAAAVSKAGLTPSGHPLVVFSKADDNGFHYEAMIPLDKAPDAKIKLADGVEAGASPTGKALKFEHRGSYDEIESTYEAITAYLDEKGLDSENRFIEEYLTDLTAAEDANVDVDIYVFLK
ncbi:MAG TPA: GyrI-like domain-containing protein [Methylocystis sp.]|nr:GyrI-like domain-containing protein [Methylocystis sp.]